MIESGVNGVFVSASNKSFEPVATYRYIATIKRAPASLRGWNTDDLKYIVRRITPGARVIDVGNFKFLNKVIQYPIGRGVPQSCTLTLGLFVEKGGSISPAYTFMRKWNEMVYSERSDASSVGLITESGYDLSGTGPSQFAVNADIEISLYGPDSTPLLNNTPKFRVLLKDCFPSQTQLFDLNMEDGEGIASLAFTLAVNDWQIIES
jgi:hypothetical protein